MNLKSILSFAGALLGTAAAVNAQSLDRAVFSIGTTTTNAQGHHWAYVLWQPTEHNALAGHKLAVYAKQGAADSLANYERKTITQRHTDPLVIQSLLARSANLGDNLALLETRINGMFAAAIPQTNLTLAHKISAVIRGAQNDPKLMGNIVFLGRVHPSLNLCLGHAWADTVPAVGKTTFEIRDFDAANNKDLGVIGRVTVDPSSPLVLPPPGIPVKFDEQSAKGDLNIKLRWATPDVLREVGLLQHGYNLYRMTRAFAESGGYHTNPPSPSQVRGLLVLASDHVKQVNETPILVNQLFDAGSAPDFSTNTVWYFADDNGRYRVGGTSFNNGDQFYYFATARDLLGRDGYLSAGGLATACDRLPPEAPKGVQVENFYSFNPITSVTKQVLKVQWPQLPNTGDVINAYFIYRWTNAVDASKVGPTNSLLNRIAGPIAHVDGQPFGTYIDSGAGAPQAPADYGKTFWYTVRAADAGACTNNLSPNSSPAFGVLRDRTAPGAPEGSIGILCCNPLSRPDKDFLTSSSGTDTNLAHYRFTVTRTNQNLAFARFYYQNAGTTNLIATVPFPSGTAPVVYDWSINRALAFGPTHQIFCRVVAKDDKETALMLGSNDPLPPVNSRLDVNWFAWVKCERIRLFDGPLAGRNECGPHTPINPDDGVTIEPPDIFFLPPAGSKEFRLYRRVDGGPLTLIKQGPVTADPPTEMEMQDPNPPANSAVVCYYVQCLDEHGNAGPLTQISDCLKWKFPSPKPLLSPLLSDGGTNAPLMNISWFCPPFGIERFEVYIAKADGSVIPPDLASNLTPSSIAQPVPKPVKFGQLWLQKQFHVFRTPRVGPQFGEGGGLFQVTANIELNHKYYVFIKPVGLDGEPDADAYNSKTESFLWTVKSQQGPQVPWPERPLPGVSTNALPDYVRPVFINNPNVTTNFAGIGLVVGVTDKPGSRHEGTGPARIGGNQDPLIYIANTSDGQSLFPLVAYRYQETNGNFRQVSGDVVQVTPLMEKIAYNTVNDPNLGVNAFIHDPFIDVLDTPLIDGGGLAVGRRYLVLYDTQPVIYGARYRYVLVRFGKDREITEVIPTQAVDAL